MNDVLIWLLTAVHVVVAVFLIILVLMQKSQDQGVGAAFGGGVTENVFGAGTTSALVRITVWCAGIMLGTTLILAVLHSRRDTGHADASVSQKVLQAPAPVAPNASSQAPMLPVQPMTTPSGTVTPSAPVELPAAAPSTDSKPAAPAATKP